MRVLDESERIRLEAFIGTLVGPAPWFKDTFPLPAGPHRWRTADDGFVDLQRGGLWRRTVLSVPWGARVIPAEESDLAVWRSVGEHVVVRVYRPTALDPLRRRRKIKLRDAQIVASAAPIEEIRIPDRLPEGTHELRPTNAFAAPEVFLLAHLPVLSDPEFPDTSLYVWAPRQGTVRVLPQLWLRERPLDTGWQWIARVGRDPVTGVLVGDGMRLGPFELDPSGTQLAEFRGWLRWEWRHGTGPPSAERSP